MRMSSYGLIRVDTVPRGCGRSILIIVLWGARLGVRRLVLVVSWGCSLGVRRLVLVNLLCGLSPRREFLFRGAVACLVSLPTRLGGVLGL
jgi:hypothetical protein